MAISDYAGLAQSIKTWTARSDATFSNQIETFVGLHELRMYNGSGEGPGDALYCDALSAPEMEANATVVMTDGAGTLPTDASTVRAIKRSGDLYGLEYMSPAQWAVMDAASQGGDPLFYTVEGTTLKVTPSYTGDLTVLYWRKFAALTAADDNNAILTAYPLVYLTGSLFEAFSFMQDVETAMAWFGKYRALVAGLNTSANSVRFGGRPLRVRTRQGMP